jgi:hypothetical protein
MSEIRYGATRRVAASIVGSDGVPSQVRWVDAPRVAVVEARHGEARFGEPGEQPVRPVDHLHAEAHDEQQRLAAVVADLLERQ